MAMRRAAGTTPSNIRDIMTKDWYSARRTQIVFYRLRRLAFWESLTSIKYKFPLYNHQDEKEPLRRR